MMTSASITQSDQTLKISGDMTFSTVKQLRTQGQVEMSVMEAPEIDFNDVTKCDSSALVLLLAWMRHAKSSGKVLKFKQLPQQLLAVAQLCGIKDLLLDNTDK